MCIFGGIFYFQIFIRILSFLTNLIECMVITVRGRRRSDYTWNHAREIIRGGNKYIRCNYCSHEMCNCSITKMKMHLAGVVGFGKVCTKVPQAVREGFKENFVEDPLLKVQRLKHRFDQKQVPPLVILNPGSGEASQHSTQVRLLWLIYYIDY